MSSYTSCRNLVKNWALSQKKVSLFGVRSQLTFLFIVSHECRAYEIVKWELNKFILCDMSAFEQEYSHVCLEKLLAVKQCIFCRV